jgi:hypothetical protein
VSSFLNSHGACLLRAVKVGGTVGCAVSGSKR